MPLSTTYRPLRVGFCVDITSPDAVAVAASLNTWLAGGIYNPIIPIAKDDTAFPEQLIKLFGIDLLYPLPGSKLAHAFAEQHKYPDPMRAHNNFLFIDDEDGKKLQLLDVAYALSSAARATPKGKATLPSWDATDPLARAFAVEFGAYPQTPRLTHDYEEAFKSAFIYSTPRLSSRQSVEPALFNKVTPLSLTKTKLRLFGGGFGWRYPGIYIGSPDSNVDLINFWNLRASGIELRFAPLGFLDQFKGYLKAYVEAVLAWDNRQRLQNGVGIWFSREADEKAIIQASSELLAEGIHVTRFGIDEVAWNGYNVQPSSTHFERKTVLATVDHQYEAPSVTFQLPTMPVNPRKVDEPSQLLGVSIDPITEFDYRGHTLELPFLPDQNEWYGREVTLMAGDIRVSSNAFTLIVDTDDSVKTVRPISHDAIIKQLFNRSDIMATDSQPGLIARRLIEQMGGDLDKCRAFKPPGVRKLIGSLDKEGLVNKSDAMRIIYDQDKNGHASLDDHARLYIQRRESAKLTSGEVFDHLLSKGLFRPGLEPECPSCRLKVWLPIDRLDRYVECEYCGSRFDLTVQLRDRDWRYRKSGLLSKDNNQEGAIPVIMTLLQFLRTSHSAGNFPYTTALKLTSTRHGINCEADYVVLGPATMDATVSVVIGEAKTEGEITDEDISNLSAVKAAMDKDGIRVYLSFSKTGDFTKKEIERFKTLALQGDSPILFTQRELEPYHPYDYYSREKIKLPEPYGGSFTSMARNSSAVYLEGAGGVRTE
jgi:hypothetical protein